MTPLVLDALDKQSDCSSASTIARKKIVEYKDRMFSVQPQGRKESSIIEVGEIADVVGFAVIFGGLASTKMNCNG